MPSVIAMAAMAAMTAMVTMKLCQCRGAQAAKAAEATEQKHRGEDGTESHLGSPVNAIQDEQRAGTKAFQAFGNKLLRAFVSIRR
jgi:hypothetical protein